MDSTKFGDFISPFEAEYLVKEIKLQEIEEYGSPKWFDCHEIIDKLNMQAHKNAKDSTDEYIMDTFATQDKMKDLIYNLIVSESWKEHLFPLLKECLSKVTSFKSYLCLQHEATICNLLEIMLFHRTACEAAEDSLLELIDYVYRKLLKLFQMAEKGEHGYAEKSTEDYKQFNPLKELEQQFKDIEFSICMICISLTRFISDHIKHLSVPVVHQIMENNDVLMILVPLIEEKPWIRTNVKGERQKFEEQKWETIERREFNRVPKIEAQIWLTIYNLFMSENTRSSYEITSFRKDTLLRLRKYLNDVLVDQIPVLTHMHRTLEEMAIAQVNSGPTKNVFVIQQLPEMRISILKDKNWSKIAKMQKEKYFTETAESRKKDMKRIMELYKPHLMEEFMEPPKCAKCGKTATQRCSRCKNEWYCSRECQVKCWKTHKPICDVIVAGEKKKAAEDAKEAEIEEAEKKKKEVKKPLIQELEECD